MKKPKKKQVFLCCSCSEDEESRRHSKNKEIKGYNQCWNDREAWLPGKKEWSKFLGTIPYFQDGEGDKYYMVTPKLLAERLGK